MPDLEPFPGLRYAAVDRMADLICPPYDVISPEEQSTLLARDAHNAVHLELARPGSGGDAYAAARRAFDEWLSAGVLVADEPALYIYRQDFITADGIRRRVAGVMGALRLEPFGEAAGVLPHERTMPGPKEDRLALLRALEVNVSPIYAIYRGGGELVPYLVSLENRPPQIRCVDDREVLHRLWVVTAPAEIEMLAHALSPGPLVIADGHHRYETALEFHQRTPGPGSGSILCFAVDADSEELVVLPYNRVLRAASAPELEGGSAVPLDGRDATEALAASGADHPFVLITSRGRFLVELSDEEVLAVLGERPAAWRALDVVALHEVLLPRLFGEAIDEVRFTKDPGEVSALVREGWTAGVLLRAIAPTQVVDVATSGERMPQKASYFWPKAATGLVFRSLR